jgi:hypothetical protein
MLFYTRPKKSLTEEQINNIKKILDKLTEKEYERLLKYRKLESNNRSVYFKISNYIEDEFSKYEKSVSFVERYLNSLKKEQKSFFGKVEIWYSEPAVWQFDNFVKDWLARLPCPAALSFDENQKRYYENKSIVYNSVSILRKALEEFKRTYIL